MAAQYENLSSDLIWQISRTLPTREIHITREREEGNEDMLVERDGMLWGKKCCTMVGHEHVSRDCWRTERTRYRGRYIA